MHDAQSNIVGAYDAEAHFSELLEKVAAGEEIIITRHGTPVARLAPVKRRTTSDERRAAIARWRTSAQALSLGDLTIKDLVNEGRR